MKRCPTCEQVLPASAFTRNKQQRSGLSAYCKVCQNARAAAVRARRMADPEQLAAYNAKRRAWRVRRHTERLAIERVYNAGRLDLQRAYMRAYVQAHPGLWTEKSRVRRARKAGAPLNDLTPTQWRAIKEHYGNRCVYCGRKMQRLTQDHITPLSKGGSHTLSNVVPACQSCNSSKFTGPPPVPVQPLLLVG